MLARRYPAMGRGAGRVANVSGPIEQTAGTGRVISACGITAQVVTV
jgi:hypothetical protein